MAMGKVLRAIRGATTLDIDAQEEVIKKTQELLGEVFTKNDLEEDDVVSIVFTTTPDIVSAFPATAARSMGLEDTPLLGACEQSVAGSPKLCIRLLVHCYMDAPKSAVRHVYLHGATVLRPDIRS